MVDYLKKIIAPILTIVILWEIIVRVFAISPLTVPSPLTVLKAFESNFYSLFSQSLLTFAESFLGLLIALVVAFIIVVIFYFFPILKRYYYSIVVSFRAIPIIALAPVVVLIIPSYFLSKVVLASIVAFFPIFISFSQGVHSLNEETLNYINIVNGTTGKVFWHIRLPQALPDLFTGLKISSTFSVMGAIVAEFIGANSGIGYIIKSSTYYYESGLTFAAIICSGIIGLITYSIFSFLEKRLIFWKKLN